MTCVLDLRMHDKSGVNVHDYSRYHNDGVLTGGEWSEHGIFLNGTNSDYITIADDPSLNFGVGSFSYGMWLYSTGNIGAYDMPIYKGGSAPANAGFSMLFGTGNWNATISDGSGAGEKAVIITTETLNEWVHALAVVDRTNNRLYGYLNGRRVGNGTDITGYGSVSHAVDLMLSNTSYPCKGFIDAVKIWDHILSPRDAMQDYNATKQRYL